MVSRGKLHEGGERGPALVGKMNARGEGVKRYKT